MKYEEEAMDTFKDYAYYYNSFYKDKDYQKEARQVDGLLQEYGKGINKIINFGCGTGKHDIAFADLGYKCTGIDMSGLMISLARENVEGKQREIKFSVEDIRAYEPKEKYDAVISLFHVMSYQIENEDIVNAFRSARKALNVGGIFLFDIWYGPGVLSDKHSLRVKEVVDDGNRIVRIAKPAMHDKENRVDVSYEVMVIHKSGNYVKTMNEIHKMRYFFIPELKMFLMQAGFRFVNCLDCQSLKETGYGSWTCYIIAQAV